jgi:hypothetical protein
MEGKIMGTPVKWTADTERAFLLALHATGQVAMAAAAIGRSTSACYSRRDRHPTFAAAWAQALDRIEGENFDTIREAREVVNRRPRARSTAPGATAGPRSAPALSAARSPTMATTGWRRRRSASPIPP